MGEQAAACSGAISEYIEPWQVHAFECPQRRAADTLRAPPANAISCPAPPNTRQATKTPPPRGGRCCAHDAQVRAKVRPFTAYADGVYRLETNPELYEGVRFAWIFFDPPAGSVLGCRRLPRRLQKEHEGCVREEGGGEGGLN